jgi:hypothetical protein
LAQMQQHARQDAVFVDVCKTAGMKGVAIIHQTPSFRKLRVSELRKRANACGAFSHEFRNEGHDQLGLMRAPDFKISPRA